MKTTDDFFKYYEYQNFKFRKRKKWYEKNFRFLSQQLRKEEEVRVIFDGLVYNLRISVAKVNYVIAVTNKRILLVKKGIFSRTAYTIQLNFINDIATRNSFLQGSILIISTMKDAFQVWAPKNDLQVIHNLILDALEKDKEESA